MGDAQADDTRPLTGAERANLADCLFRLFSAIHHNHKLQEKIILALHNNAGIDIDASHERGLFAHDMGIAINLIDKINESFGISSDG